MNWATATRVEKPNASTRRLHLHMTPDTTRCAVTEWEAQTEPQGWHKCGAEAFALIDLENDSAPPEFRAIPVCFTHLLRAAGVHTEPMPEPVRPLCRAQGFPVITPPGRHDAEA